MTDAAVQNYLEGQIGELRSLIEAGLLSQEETRGLVNQRRNFEYQVKGRECTKSTWMRYIEFELNVESLRAMRARRMAIRGPDACMRQSMVRIHHIFNRALRRFRGDVGLWLQWIQFSKERGSTTVLSKSIANAVLIYPLQVDLWLLAADWEFTNEGNMQTARSLLLRGIRANPKEQRIWVEYFKLELKYLCKIQKRIDLVTPKATFEVPDDEDDDDSADQFRLDNDAADGVQERNAAADALVAQSLPQITDSAFFKGEICNVVLRNALDSFPGSFKLYFDMWKVVEALEAQPTLQESFVGIGKTHFSSGIEFWQFLKIKGLANNDDEALEHLSGIKAWEFKVFCAGDNLETIAHTCEQCHASGEMNAALMSTWIAALLRTQSDDRAVQIGKKGVLSFPQDAQLWFDYLTASLVRFKRGKEPLVSLLKLFQTAIKAVESSMVRKLMVRLLFALSEDQFDEGMLVTAVGHDEEAALSALDLMQTSSMSHAKQKQICANLITFCGTQSVFEKTIELELDQDVKRKLLEEATDRFGSQNATFWLQWAAMETALGKIDQAGIVHYRAKKMLKGVALTKYLEMTI